MTRTPIDVTNTLVIVPAFNESQNIVRVINDLKSYQYNFVIVNDASIDNTANLVRSNFATILDLPINLGVGGALRTGFQYAVKCGYEAVVQVDADGQHPVSHISDLMNAANTTNADMIIGSRFLNGLPVMRLSSTRRLAMRLLALSASRASRCKITDSTSGFRLIRNPLLKKFSHRFSSNYLGDTYEAIVSSGRSGFKISEISAPIIDRQNGLSSSSTTQAARQTIKVVLISLLHLHIKY